MKERAQESEEEDLLGSFEDEADEDDMLFEPTAFGSTGKPSAQKAQPQMSDEEEESILDDLLAQSNPSEVKREKQNPLRARAEAALRISEESQSEEAAAPSSSESAAQATAASPARVAGASISEISAAAEELIGRMESRLQEHIRVVVESILPGLVRSIIDEEITKLKQELE